MESKDMSTKELQELLKKELGSVENAKEESEIAEMLRHDGQHVKQIPPRQRRILLEQEPAEEPIQETAEEPVAEQPVQPQQPVKRGKYERIPEEGEVQSFSLPKAEDMIHKRGKYEKPSGDEEGYFNPETPKETAGERRRRAQRNSRIMKIIIGFAVVFVVSLGVGLIVNTIQAKNRNVKSGDDQTAMSVQTGTDAQGNVIEIEQSTEECNILGIAPIQNFVAVLEGETKPLQVSMTTKGAADGNDLMWESSDPAVAEVSENGTVTGVGAGECTITVSAKGNPAVSAQMRCVIRHMEQRDGVTYVDDILLINKSYGVDENYEPGGLTEETSAAFDTLCADAAAEGLDIYIGSGYRSYYDQDVIFNNYTEIYGWEVADTFSARPGHSEHQSGMAIDVNTIDDAFGETPEAAWLKEHCAEYGFIIRYAADKVDITGYKYEPWHIRYVGTEVAKELTQLGISMEEYLGVDSVYAEDWQ